MDIVEAIKTRKSIRAFKPDPVPRELLTELLELSLRAPSWANTQPWELAVVGGKVMEGLKQGLWEEMTGGTFPQADIPWPDFPEGTVYRQRMRDNGRQLFAHLGIAREDRERRRQHNLTMARLFEAPNLVIVCIDRSLGAWSILDAGIIIQTIMLAALNYGLGTCPMAQAVACPDVLRRLLGIPESKLIVCGIAIGYPDADAHINKFRSTREPLENLATWHGFD